MVVLLDRILQATKAKVVLSSTWRLDKSSREEVRRRVVEFIDVTPQLLRNLQTGGFIKAEDADVTQGGFGSVARGYEIQDWLDRHPEVEKYAILDDDPNMLERQIPNFFQTQFYGEGLTEDISKKVIEHFNGAPQA